MKWELQLKQDLLWKKNINNHVKSHEKKKKNAHMCEDPVMGTTVDTGPVMVLGAAVVKEHLIIV